MDLDDEIENPEEVMDKLRDPDEAMSAVLKSPIKMLHYQRISDAINKLPNLWYLILCTFKCSRHVFSSIRERVHEKGLSVGEILVELMQDDDVLTIEQVLQTFDKHNMYDAKRRLQYVRGNAILFKDLRLYQSQQLSIYFMNERRSRLMNGWENIVEDLGLERHIKELSRFPYTFGEAVLDYLDEEGKTIGELREKLIEIFDDKSMKCKTVEVVVALDREVRIIARKDIQSAPDGDVAPQPKAKMYQKVLNIYVNLQVAKERYFRSFFPRKECKFEESDCRRDSKLRMEIVDKIHLIFEEQLHYFSPELSSRPCSIKVSSATIVPAGNYLPFEFVVKTCDGPPPSDSPPFTDKYVHFDTPESRDLWDQVKPVIINSAQFDDFETSVDLQDWKGNPTVMTLNLTKKLQEMWTVEEAEAFVSRINNGMAELYLVPPLEFISVNTNNFLKFQVDISSPCEEVIESFRYFKHSFQRTLNNRTVNGDPDFRETVLLTPEEEERRLRKR